MSFWDLVNPLKWAEHFRAESSERREESKDLRGILDEQIREMEARVKEAPAQDERSERQRSLDELRRRKVVLLETQIRSHPEYEAFTAKLGAGQEGRASVMGFQMPEVALLPGEPEATAEAVAAMRLDGIALGFGQAGRHELAELVFAEALTLDASSPSRWYNRGVMRHRLGRHEEALADYNRSLEVRPDDPGTLTNRGAALAGLGRHQEAVADLDRSLELRPDHADTLNNRGAALGDLGRHEEALADYNRALELRPDHPLSLFNRACAYALQRRVDEAVDDLRRAIQGESKHRDKARTDPDFDGIRADPRFRALVGEHEPPAEADSP